MEKNEQASERTCPVDVDPRAGPDCLRRRGTRPADAAADKTITVYTSEPQAKIDQVVEAFEKANEGVNIEVFRAATGEIKSRIATERQSGKISADVIPAADVPTFEAYAAEVAN